MSETSPATTPTTPTPTTLTFSSELVAAAAGRVHTYESWARAVIAEAMKRASTAEAFDAHGMTVSADITIRPESTGRDPKLEWGTKTCGGIELFGIRLHVELIES